MKFPPFLVFFLGLAAQQNLHANGGGYYRGGVQSAGDVAGFEPSATENVRILDEKLTITLGPKEADVEVRYLMRNETDKKVKVRFGFPVEESFDDDEMGMEPSAKKKPADGKKLEYCKHYQITAAGNAIESKWQGELKNSEDARFKGVAGWLISELTFAAHEEKPVMIRFQSAYPMSEWSVSDNTSKDAAIFRYRLSTAACWNGSIGTGKIVLKPNGIRADDLKVIKPVNRFKKEGANWVWNFENLEPSLADDFEVEAAPAENSYPQTETGADGDTHITGTYIERGSRWSMAHSNYKVKASSTLPPDGEIKYDADNIKNFWGEMWSEGAKGPGINEWLELEPIAPKPLTAISILPGCVKTQELFEANARPKKMMVELNDEHKFTVDVPDSKEEFEFPVSDYTKAVKKIRLTFVDVWPGKKFEDLCVSSVRLHVALDKKPKLQPVR